MLARGVRRYHRPSTVDEALALRAAGAVPLAGGTRLFAAERTVEEVLDLGALDLRGISALEDGDLALGALVTLQDAIDSPLVDEATGGLLPLACRTQTPSWMLREMATLGGESVHVERDSLVVAALLALNAVYVVARPGGVRDEVPGLRFLRNPQADVGDGLLVGLHIAAAPDGAALERVAAVPSAPPLVSVAVAVAFNGDLCARTRIALTGLASPPARVLEAEARMEGSTGDPRALERCIEQIALRAPFRSDAHASAEYRREVARVLTRRALLKALDRARAHPQAAEARRPRPPRARPPARGAFEAGPVTLQLNGRPLAAPAAAGAVLLDVLRRAGAWGVKHGCETGECGACTVLVDGRPQLACLMLAAQVDGRSVTTVEALGTPDALHPVQQAFVDTGAIQCGYCTPAMELAAKALLDAVPRPSEGQVRDALAGCLCRCTGYVKPVQAVLQAAAAPQGDGSSPERPVERNGLG